MSLDAAPLLSKLSISAMVIRGVPWPVDQMSKKALADLPVQGEQLFGATLHNIIKNLMKGKSTFFLQSTKGEHPSHKQDPSFCTQVFFLCTRFLGQRIQALQGSCRLCTSSLSLRTSLFWHYGFPQPVFRVEGRLRLFTGPWTSLQPNSLRLQNRISFLSTRQSFFPIFFSHCLVCRPFIGWYGICIARAWYPLFWTQEILLQAGYGTKGRKEWVWFWTSRPWTALKLQKFKMESILLVMASLH